MPVALPEGKPPAPVPASRRIEAQTSTVRLADRPVARAKERSRWKETFVCEQRAGSQKVHRTSLNGHNKATAHGDEPTPTTGGLSRVELRRHLLRRASTLAVRAKSCRARGDVAKAARMQQEAHRLLRVARDMGRHAQ
jgi:hypothetical protein